MAYRSSLEHDVYHGEVLKMALSSWGGGSVISVRFFFALVGIVVSSLAIAENPRSTSRAKAVRAAGDYLVSRVTNRNDGGFLIEFRSEQPTGRFDLLKLSSDHVHVAVKVGEKIRLSAEVSSETGSSAEISQVVLFFPNPTGAVPVWLLSNREQPRDLNAVNYLKMHVPQTDYMLL